MNADAILRDFGGRRALSPNEMPIPQPLTRPRQAAPTPEMATEAVLGVPLALTDYEHTLDWIDAAVASAMRASTSASPPCTR